MKHIKLSITSLALIFVCVGIGKADTYQPMIPDAWKSSISVGEITIDSNAFYGVPWNFGLYPAVRFQLPVENLTSETLYFKINTRTEGKKRGYGNSGMGTLYTLQPREKRLIDTIAPIGSATIPICFKLRMSEPFHDPDSTTPCNTHIITIDPFKVSTTGKKDVEQTNVKNEYFKINTFSIFF